MLPLTLSELSEHADINWTEVQNNLKYNARNFENLLFKIHLKRKNKVEQFLKEIYLHFFHAPT